MPLLAAIAAGDAVRARRLLAATPELARQAAAEGATRQSAREFYFDAIEHYLYAGDTALHFAAGGYGTAIAARLLRLGADASARNRLGAEPLHYAAMGRPGSPAWSPKAQAGVIALLIDAGADPDAADAGGVTPLHRAVRSRCADAVRALLAGGGDARRKTGAGSTPLDLARRATGRGGTGSPAARAQQAEILELLRGA